MPMKLLTGLDILVVEDESLLRKQIAAHLESLGADVPCNTKDFPEVPVINPFED